MLLLSIFYFTYLIICNCLSKLTKLRLWQLSYKVPGVADKLRQNWKFHKNFFFIKKVAEMLSNIRLDKKKQIILYVRLQMLKQLPGEVET